MKKLTKWEEADLIIFNCAQFTIPYPHLITNLSFITGDAKAYEVEISGKQVCDDVIGIFATGVLQDDSKTFPEEIIPYDSSGADLLLREGGFY